MSNEAKLVSIVLSFRNEENVLSELIQRLKAVLDKVIESYELIFIDDDSKDKSKEILRKYADKDDRIKIITMSRRFGVSQCVIAGMSNASGDAVIYMDTDLQDPPEIIPELLNKWRNGADVVHTVRTRRQGESKLKMLMTWIGYRIIGFGSEISLPSDAGDFKLLSRRAVDHLLQFRETDPYLRGLITWIGYRQEFVEYVRDPRHSGKTHFPFFSKNPWITFISGVTSFSFFPMMLIILGGIFLGVCSVLTFITGMLKMIWSTGYSVFFWIVWIMMCFQSTTLIALGIMGIYLSRIYKDVRNRPVYIVDKTVGFDDPKPKVKTNLHP